MFLEQIQNDVKTAMKAGDKVRVDTLRFLISAIKKYEIDTYPPSNPGTLSEQEVVKILQKQVKQHKESVEAFTKANRTDLVDKEAKELEILSSYLPKELSDDEIRSIVNSVKEKGVANFGQAMGMVMKEVAGRASGDRVQKIVKEVIQ